MKADVVIALVSTFGVLLVTSFWKLSALLTNMTDRLDAIERCLESLNVTMEQRHRTWRHGLGTLLGLFSVVIQLVRR